MAYYTQNELQDVLCRLANEESAYKYVKHEKLGVVYAALKENLISELYTCELCKKKLLSSHLLSLHVSEHHDTFFELQKDRKPSYACYLEDCQVISKTHEERRDHAIQDHKFPHDFYDFKTSSKESTLKNDEDEVMESSAQSTSSKKKSNYFQFGHKANKTFQSKPRNNQQHSKDFDMKSIGDALEDATN